jgi:hypothetical protein
MQVSPNRKPYKQIIIGGENIIRTFNQDTKPEELVWHRDEKDRTVIIIEDTDWQFQFDNQLPLLLNKGMTLFIKAGEYHRVIKGTTSLTIRIKEE